MKRQKERSKSKITSKHVTIIAIIMYAIYVIQTLIYLITTENSGKNGMHFVVTIILIVVTIIMAYIISNEFILKEYEREKEEADKKLKEKIQGKLKQNCFEEIELIPYEINKQTEMFEQILKNIGGKFYAKLLDIGEILIVCKDRHNNTVYEEIVENYYWFEMTFKFKKD